MMCLFNKSDASEYCRIDGNDVTITGPTVYHACVQDFTVGGANMGDLTLPNTEDTPPEHIQINMWGKFQADY